MQVGDKYFVRDNWIDGHFMVPKGEIVHISYEQNSSTPSIVLMRFEGSFKTYWFPVMALKKE